MRFSAKQIGIYLLIAFGLAWANWILLYLFTKDIDNPTTIQILFTVSSAIAMWMPGLAVLVLWLMNGRTSVLGVSFQPHFAKAWPAYLIAWLGPAVATLLGAILYFVTFPGTFTTTFPVFRDLPNAAIIPEDQYGVIAATQLISGILIGPFLNIIVAFGEELGWRGFLFPALSERYSPWVTHLLMGLIWGLWHAPLTAQGHNYGKAYMGYPYLGWVAMCCFCFGAGIVLSYCTARSGSIWPAALGHGAINAISGAPLLFVDPKAINQLLGPHLPGMVACLPLILFGLWLIPRFPKQPAITGEIPVG